MAWDYNNVTGTDAQTIEQIKHKADKIGAISDDIDDLDERVTALEDAPASGGFVTFDAGDASVGQTKYGNGYEDAVPLPNTPSAVIKASDMVQLTMYAEFIGSTNTYTFNMIRNGDAYTALYCYFATVYSVIWMPNDNIIYYLS